MGKLPQRVYRRLYLAEWLAVLECPIPKAAKAAGCTQSYLRNIIAERKANPSAHVLFALTEHLGITINDLFRPPPPAAAVAALSSLSPAARAALLRKTSDEGH